ncbi:MAG: hypothetical protein OEZ14_01680 [Acidimicrobiia bacterium]|nr:hypothetical protein [Acidimicrobiia bacterium]MDH5519219.1 hypothetical protein [Acidimicrobiia bacterium]
MSLSDAEQRQNADGGIVPQIDRVVGLDGVATPRHGGAPTTLSFCGLTSP